MEFGHRRDGFKRDFPLILFLFFPVFIIFGFLFFCNAVLEDLLGDGVGCYAVGGDGGVEGGVEFYDYAGFC